MGSTGMLFSKHTALFSLLLLAASEQWLLFAQISPYARNRDQ